MSSADEEELRAFGITLLASPGVPLRARWAHDITNCVGSIVALTFLAERDPIGFSSERASRLREVSERLRNLVRTELLEGSIEIPSSPPETFCVLELARDVVDRALDRAAWKGVRMHLHAEPARLRGTRDLLDEALFNLVTNAIDATPAGGDVFVSCSRSSTGDHEWLVRDTGCGIAAEQLADLGRVGRSRKERGSGFGLAIAQDAIREHGGVLRIESRQGAGTTFLIFLPAC